MKFSLGVSIGFLSGARAHRRHRDRRRDASDGRALSRPHPELGRPHRGRRLRVHDPCPPRRRGNRLGPLRDRADHPWRERPAPASGAPAMSSHRPASPVSSSSPMGRWGRRDFVHDPGAALHEDLWPEHEQLAMVSVVQREDEVDRLCGRSRARVAGTGSPAPLWPMRRAVGHQATLQQRERVDDHPRVQHILHGDRPP